MKNPDFYPDAETEFLTRVTTQSLPLALGDLVDPKPHLAAYGTRRMVVSQIMRNGMARLQGCGTQEFAPGDFEVVGRVGWLERMTASQLIFFMLAATSDLAGRPATFGDIKEMVGDRLNRSLHTTYRILMEPSRAFPKGLGWLTSDLNPADNRQKFIKLTPEGRKVMKALHKALKG